MGLNLDLPDREAEMSWPNDRHSSCGTGSMKLSCILKTSQILFFLALLCLLTYQYKLDAIPPPILDWASILVSHLIALHPPSYKREDIS